MRRRPVRGLASAASRGFAATPATSAALSLALAGCFGTPTPLAPGLSGSVGWPHHGVQTDAVELPEAGVGFARYRARDGHYWGQPELVLGIQAAAARVEAEFPGGEPLLVGDLSARFGGKIARHHSHRSGRDVDLLWYLARLDGAPVKSSSFVPLSGGRPAWLPRQGYVALDTRREWALVAALLASPYLDVQFLYASKAVEALLLEHARAIGADPALIERAADVMLEPTDSLPHDDHLHLRIACSRERSVAGCEGGGPSWSWLGAPPELGPGDAELDLFAEDPS
jgi:penicillin-insensitive murein DD-endopeptidase